ncbi:MAG: CsbD family protein [Nitriliruptorales bacterium]|nr:CsbD family protein [Nitriliruptorales bacterium]
MSNTDDAKGRAKEAAGDLTGNERMKREGKLDRASGSAKDAVDKAKGKAREVADKFTRGDR